MREPQWTIREQAVVYFLLLTIFLSAFFLVLSLGGALAHADGDWSVGTTGDPCQGQPGCSSGANYVEGILSLSAFPPMVNGMRVRNYIGIKDPNNPAIYCYAGVGVSQNWGNSLNKERWIYITPNNPSGKVVQTVSLGTPVWVRVFSIPGGCSLNWYPMPGEEGSIRHEDVTVAGWDHANALDYHVPSRVDVHTGTTSGDPICPVSAFSDDSDISYWGTFEDDSPYVADWQPSSPSSLDFAVDYPCP